MLLFRCACCWVALLTRFGMNRRWGSSPHGLRALPHTCTFMFSSLENVSARKMEREASVRGWKCHGFSR